MHALLCSKSQLIIMNISLVFQILVSFKVFLLSSVKYFAQICRIDPVDFLNPETLIFPMIYKMSLCKFFSCRPQNQRNCTGLLFQCGHYFFKRVMQACIPYLFLQKTSFSSFSPFCVFCFEVNVLNEDFIKSVIII